MASPDLRSAAYLARQVIAAHQSDNLGDDPDSAFAAPLAALNEALDPPTPAQLRTAGKVDEADKLCVSWLVSELMKRTGERDSILDEDDACTLASRAPGVDDYRDALPSGYTVESGIDPADGATAWRWFGDDMGGPDPEDSDWFETEEEALRDLFEQERLDEPDGSEAFEHWAVSRWLADKLEAKGESVVETDFAGHVWARCTTGQMIRMDSVIRSIARDLCARELTGVDA